MIWLTCVIYKTIYCGPCPLQPQYNFLKTVTDSLNWRQKVLSHTTSKLDLNVALIKHTGYTDKFVAKGPLPFRLKITSLVSFGFTPFNLHCYGKPLDLDRAQNHWGHHNGVWQLLFSHLFRIKIKIPGKVNQARLEISFTTLETAVKIEYLIRCGIQIWIASAFISRRRIVYMSFFVVVCTASTAHIFYVFHRRYELWRLKHQT